MSVPLLTVPSATSAAVTGIRKNGKSLQSQGRRIY